MAGEMITAGATSAMGGTAGKVYDHFVAAIALSDVPVEIGVHGSGVVILSDMEARVLARRLDSLIGIAGTHFGIRAHDPLQEALLRVRCVLAVPPSARVVRRLSPVTVLRLDETARGAIANREALAPLGPAAFDVFQRVLEDLDPPLAPGFFEQLKTMLGRAVKEMFFRAVDRIFPIR